MNEDAWRSYPSAPIEGVAVCALSEVPAGGAKSLKIASGNGEFPVLLVRQNGTIRAYVNACPHQYLPLDYRSGQLLSADGARLMCSAHGSMFEVETGQCVGGPAQGCALDPVPVIAGSDGIIRIGGKP